MTEPRFLCDEMLGKLARDLRALGYDAAYARGMDDEAVLTQAADEDRLLLTRDRALATRAGERAVRVAALEPDEQLAELARALDLTAHPSAFLSRCLACNTALADGAGDRAVPASVPEGPRWHCPGCGRTYWLGSHAADMRGRLGAYLGDDEPGPPDRQG